MNLAEYSKILTKLPMNYKVRQAHEINLCFFRGDVIMSHPEEKPIIYRDKDWVILKFDHAVQIK